MEAESPCAAARLHLALFGDIITEIIIEKQEKEFGKSETPHKSERECNTENCNAFILLFKFIINSYHIL